MRHVCGALRVPAMGHMGVCTCAPLRAASRVGYGVPTVRIYREVGVCVAGCVYGMLPAPAARHTRLARARALRVPHPSPLDPGDPI